MNDTRTTCHSEKERICCYVTVLLLFLLFSSFYSLCKMNTRLVILHTIYIYIYIYIFIDDSELLYKSLIIFWEPNAIVQSILSTDLILVSPVPTAARRLEIQIYLIKNKPAHN
jgi:hypothetical protein